MSVDRIDVSAAEKIINQMGLVLREYHHNADE